MLEKKINAIKIVMSAIAIVFLPFAGMVLGAFIGFFIDTLFLGSVEGFAGVFNGGPAGFIAGIAAGVICTGIIVNSEIG